MSLLDTLLPTILNEAHQASEVCGYAQVVASLDGLVGYGVPLAELIPDQGESVEATVLGHLDCEALTAALRRVRLTKQERQVLTLRYGLKGGTPLTHRAIAAQMGMSHAWARCLEHSALAKLREAPAIKALA